MLGVVLKFQKAFELFKIQDIKYRDELTRGEKSKGLPMPSDWEYARYLLPFLKNFYDATLCVSSSLFVTNNAYMCEIFAIGMQISTCCRSNDVVLSTIAGRMKGKHDKYWSNIDNISLMLFIAMVLDPRFKLEYTNIYKLIYASPSGQSSQQSQQASQINVEDVNVDPKELMYSFSTEGCVLDLFHSSLTPKTVEALICTQDWIRAKREPFMIEESLEEISELESEFVSLAMENTTRVHLDD
ncbi:zinc finger BED domain-containing protein RICESLEEPER 1-like [Pistacia vera]|uniref:zinc finger BED domain-containing protein RICESLEEPER 1-like n=1 Tax=Pistacia vera TaxID=55513 RepID=UPI0012634B74|nr:zinc finger BED domain-containing protein RICESLEEPER 1-like [Pistacia vera]